MKAVVLNAIGAPMAVEEIPTPEPRAGEVMIRVEACGVCHTDLHVIKAEVRFPTPCVLGHEVSGTVVAHGPGLSATDAERLKVGRAGGRRVHHAVRHLLLLRAGPGRPLRDVLHRQPAPGQAVRRRHPPVSTGRLAGLDVLDGRARRVRGHPRDRRRAAAGRSAVRRLGDPGLRRLHGVRRGPSRRRPPGRRVGRGGGDGRRRLEHHPAGAGVRGLPDRGDRRPRRQARRCARARGDPRHQRRERRRRRAHPRADGRSGRRRGVRGAGPAGDVRAGGRHRASRWASRDGRDRPGRRDRARRDHAAGPARRQHHRLVRRQHPGGPGRGDRAGPERGGGRIAVGHAPLQPGPGRRGVRRARTGARSSAAPSSR